MSDHQTGFVSLLLRIGRFTNSQMNIIYHTLFNFIYANVSVMWSTGNAIITRQCIKIVHNITGAFKKADT